MTLQYEDPLSVFNLASLRFPDDFDEYQARADSGGSTYGLLKRHAFAHSSLRERSTTAAALQKPTQRQRSKSLVPPAAEASRLKCLADEKIIIQALCERSTDAGCGDRNNTLQLQVIDYRRHSSTATCTASIAPDLKKRGSLALVQDHTSSGKPMLLDPTAQDCGGPSARACPMTVPVCRRRSFSVTPRGLVNEGDEVIPVIPSEMLLPDGGTGLLLQLQMQGGSGSRRSSYNSCHEGVSGGWMGSDDGSSNDAYVHRVLMLGGPGVGKTALTQQFLTSEFMAAQNTSFDDGREITVPVLLDGEESIMEFIDLPYSGELDVWRDYDVDGYIIVYSITDRRSYQKASDVMTAIKDRWNNIRPIILVANKSDLERSRMIGKEEGKGLAQSNDCKYIEVSAILNHKVDDLLVGMLKQIRLSLRRQKKSNKHRQSTVAAGTTGSSDPRRPTIDIEMASNSTGGEGGEAEEDERGKGCLSTKPCRNGVFAKLFRGSKKMSSKSCENLLIS